MLTDSFAARAKSALFTLDTREIASMVVNGRKFEKACLYVCVELHIVTFVVGPLSGRTVFLFRSALVCANPTEIYPKSALHPKLNVFRVTYEAHPRCGRMHRWPRFLGVEAGNARRISSILRPRTNFVVLGGDTCSKLSQSFQTESVLNRRDFPHV